MTPLNDSKRTDGAGFEARLTRLIAEARNGNEPLCGAFTVRSPDPEVQDYEIDIVPVTNRSPR